MKNIKAYILLLIAMFAVMPVLSAPADAQSDSLRQLLSHQTGKQRLLTLKQLAYRSQFLDDVNYNRRCIDELLLEAQRLGDIDFEGEARITMMAFFYNRQRDSLISASPRHLEFFKEHRQWDNYYYAWKMAIEYYAYTKQYTTALDESQNMNKDAQSRNDDYGMAYSSFCLGVVYATMGSYEESIRAYEDCLMHRQLDARLKRSVYYYLCESLTYLEDYKRLMNYTEEYWKQLRVDYPDMDEPTLASTPQATPCLIFRARALTAMGSLEEANKMLTYAAPTATKRQMHHYHLLYALVEYDKAMKDLPQALKHSDELMRLVIEMKRPETEANQVDVQRAKLMMDMGNDNEAARLWQEVYQRTTKSNTTDMQRQLSEMNTMFQVNRLKLQGERTKQQARFVSGSMAAILVVVGLLFFLGINSRWSRRLEVKNRQLERERNLVVAQNRQLATERDRAEAASRAKTAFMQSMTHEIRTPLNAISGFSQVLATPGMELTPEDSLDFSMRIQQNTQLLTNILNDMLEISDLESQKQLESAEDYPIAVIFAQAADSVQPRLHEGVQLLTQCNVPDDKVVRTHPRLVTMALDKLLDNAVKFTQQGSITLSLSSLPVVEGTGERLLFSVIDTGPGIPEDKKEYIFERFTKLDSFAQGAGLGLNVARLIAERLGGTLTLDTTHQGGSKFDLVLPFI